MSRGLARTLRPLCDADRQRWFEVRTDPAQIAFGAPAFVRPPASPDDLLEQVVASQAAYAELAPGTLAIVDENDRLLGDIAWRHDVPPPLRIADIGYSVHPDSRHRGVATAAIGLMVAWLTTDPPGPAQARVQLDHSVENLASCRTALAAGLEREGVRRGFLPLRDEHAVGGVRRHDVCLHGVAVRT
nr:GNAT family N-acetyltransferase [Nocardioides mangrovicus]